MASKKRQRAGKPPVKYQGKAVVQRCQECDACQEWLLEQQSAPRCESLLVMLPNGEVSHFRTPTAVVRGVRAWFKSTMHSDAFNFGMIEWRDGIVPPARKV